MLSQHCCGSIATVLIPRTNTSETGMLLRISISQDSLPGNLWDDPSGIKMIFKIRFDKIIPHSMGNPHLILRLRFRLDLPSDHSPKRNEICEPTQNMIRGVSITSQLIR
jgi:hypothetical protein